MLFGRRRAEREAWEAKQAAMDLKLKQMKRRKYIMGKYFDEMIEMPEHGSSKQVFGLFWMRTRVASLFFLLICADMIGPLDQVQQSTTRAYLVLRGMLDALQELSVDTEEKETELEKMKSLTLSPFYCFIGETTFKPLSNDADAVIAEIEGILHEDAPVWNNRGWRDMVMAYLLKIFDGLYSCCEAQTEVIDYLCERWKIDDEKREGLVEKIYTEKEILARADKIADMLVKAGKVSFVYPPSDAV